MVDAKTNARRGLLMVLESAFPANGGGGAESQVITLGKYFMRRGVEVTVVVPRVPYGPPATHAVVEGLPVLRIAYPMVRIVGGLILLIRLAVFLIRQRRRYSVIHVHIAHNMASVCCVVGRLLAKRVIVKLTGLTEMHHGILAQDRSGPVSWLRRSAMRFATHYQATSQRIQRLLLESGFSADKICLLPNAVDTERFRPTLDREAARRALGIDARLVGVFVGRLVDEKALDLLIDSWGRVFRGRKDVKLFLIGGGPLEAELRAVALHAGVAEQIVFTGAVQTVEQYTTAADFGILTSKNEGLSNTLLEYMAVGLPVLGSRVSGNEDLIVPGRTGWLFESGDAADLQHCLSQISAAPREMFLTLGAQARETICHYAGVESVSARLAMLYGIPLADSVTSGSAATPAGPGS
jgi:glycosyltransferase involved in cell wall biosynthesis